MTQNEITIGGVYFTRISGKLVAVQVTAQCSVRVGGFDSGKTRTAFVCKRRDTGRELPKPRTAAALRHSKNSKIMQALTEGLQALA